MHLHVFSRVMCKMSASYVGDVGDVGIDDLPAMSS